MLQSMRSAAKWIWGLIALTFVGGFVFYESSGLFGRDAVITPGTAVAEVNGKEIPYVLWQQRAGALAQQREEQIGRALTLDERKQVEDQAFEDLVTDVLLTQEYERRNIGVTDDEIRMAAQTAPPPELLQNPELQTDGRFDPAKYQRFLRSPSARQGGFLVNLENYYRGEIPRQKLLAQVAADAYVTDERLWQAWRDSRDSVVVSYVALRPEAIADNAVAVTDDEIRAYYDRRRKEFERPGRAVVSIVTIPRTVTAADSAATRQRLATLREEITSGRATFEDVAKRESTDSASAANGGDLGSGARGRFVTEFETAAYALQPGQVSEPVQTPFGFHLIKVDSRRGDTLALRHILLRVGQSDSTARLTDRRADELARIAAGSDDPAKFDAAAKQLRLTVARGVAIEDEPLTLGGRYVPSVSAWAFEGTQPGESSDLIDGEDGYYLARLDSVTAGGVPPLDQVKDEIRAVIVRQKKLDRLLPQARQLAQQARAGSLEAAAQQAGTQVTQSPPFSRLSPVPGIGRANEAIGAAFALPQGGVSQPVKTDAGVFVLRVDRRVESSRAEFDAQKAGQREQLIRLLREQRVRDYLENLRRDAEVEDRRKELNSAMRRQSA